MNLPRQIKPLDSEPSPEFKASSSAHLHFNPYSSNQECRDDIQITLGNIENQSPPPPLHQDSSNLNESFSDSGMQLLATLPITGTMRSELSLFEDEIKRPTQEKRKDSSLGLSSLEQKLPLVKDPEPSLKYFQKRTPAQQSRYAPPLLPLKNRLVVADYPDTRFSKHRLNQTDNFQKKYSFQERAEAMMMERDQQQRNTQTTNTSIRNSSSMHSYRDRKDRTRNTVNPRDIFPQTCRAPLSRQTKSPDASSSLYNLTQGRSISPAFYQKAVSQTMYNPRLEMSSYERERKPSNFTFTDMGASTNYIDSEHHRQFGERSDQNFSTVDTRGDLSSRVGFPLRSYRNSPFSTRDLKTERSVRRESSRQQIVKTESRRNNERPPRGCSHSEFSAERTRRTLSPNYSNQTHEMDHLNSRYSYIKQRQSQMLHRLSAQQLLTPSDVDKFMETTLIEQEFQRELNTKIAQNQRLQEELIKEKTNLKLKEKRAISQQNLRLLQKFSDNLRKSLLGIDCLDGQMREQLYEAVLQIGRGSEEDQNVAAFLAVAGNSFQHVCSSLKEAYGSCIEVTESQKLRNQEIETKEAELKKKEEFYYQKMKQFEEEKADYNKNQANLQRHHDELNLKVQEIEAIYREFDEEKARFYQGLQKQEEALEKESQYLNKREVQLVEKQERLLDQEKEVAKKQEQMDIEELNIKQRVRESVVKRIEEKRGKIVALIREERVEMERMRDKCLEQMSEKFKKGEQKLQKGIHKYEDQAANIERKVRENERLLQQIKRQNNLEEENYAQIKEAEADIMKQIDSIERRKNEVETAEKVMEKREHRMKEREEDIKRNLIRLDEERRMFEDQREMIEKKKIELKANYDELNHRIRILEDSEDQTQEYIENLRNRESEIHQRYNQEGMEMEDARSRLIENQENISEEVRHYVSEKEELIQSLKEFQAMKNSFERKRNQVIESLTHKERMIEATRKECHQEIENQEDRLRSMEEQLSQKALELNQDEKKFQLEVFETKKQLRERDDALLRRERRVQQQQRNIEFNVESARQRLQELQRNKSQKQRQKNQVGNISFQSLREERKTDEEKRMLDQQVSEFRKVLSQFDKQKLSILEREGTRQDKENQVPNFTMSSFQEASPMDPTPIDLSISPLRQQGIEINQYRAQGFFESSNGKETSFNLSLKEQLKVLGERKVLEGSETATFRSPLIKIAGSDVGQHSRAPSECNNTGHVQSTARLGLKRNSSQISLGRENFKIMGRDLMSSSEQENCTKLLSQVYSEDQLISERSRAESSGTMVVKDEMTLEPMQYCGFSEAGSLQDDHNVGLRRQNPGDQLQAVKAHRDLLLDSQFSSNASTLARTVVTPINLSEVLKKSIQTEALENIKM